MTQRTDLINAPIVEQKPKKRPSPTSIRFSDEERAELVERAGTRSLSSYVKSVLFFGSRTSRSIQISKNEFSRILALLGSTRVAANLALLADDARHGNLIDDEDTITQIQNACADIEEMRNALMRALGKQAPTSETVSRSKYQLVCHSFLTASELSEGRQ